METDGKTALGSPIPYGNLHALSVSLPTWQHNVGWASGNSAVVDAMQVGYPRFFVARNIQKLGHLCLEQLGVPDKLCMLFPTRRTARECALFLERYMVNSGHGKDVEVLSVVLHIPDQTVDDHQLHAVIFPPAGWKLAKSCWQHAGMGISSRYAEACLSLLSRDAIMREWTAGVDDTLFFRCGELEKLAIRERIAKLAYYGEGRPASTNAIHVPSAGDVFLYPTGMSAIWHMHQLVLAMWPGFKSVCFGFPYTDTVKILEKWGPGCDFYGQDPDTNLSALEALLTGAPACPIRALFCEFPSNPLLQSPNLARLRQLADWHGFLIIVDDTAGTFVNVNVLKYVDVITTSLSKLFSGKADVMGGSLTLNPKSKFFDKIKAHLQATYVDDYYPPDAIIMEANSRDFASRVATINANAREVCNFLRSRALSNEDVGGRAPGPPAQRIIKEVFYPEWTTRANYDLCRRPGKDDNFGMLFSLTFVSLAASAAFYDALSCAKGPSLGTNFTLTCPYTILGHFWEKEWAASYGVEEGLVRVSVGMEDRETLLAWFEKALDAALATLCSV